MPFTAQKEAQCSICLSTIYVGEATRPIRRDGREALDWSHMTCVDADDDRIPVCKHWSTRGTCIYVETCLFRHPINEKNSKGRNQKRHGSRRRLRVANEGRVGALRRWLLNVLGEEYLKLGSVVDVAGGKGELAFELQNLNGIDACVIDPRPLELNRFNRKLKFGYYHRNDILGAYNTMPQPMESCPPVKPQHIRGFFEMPGLGRDKIHRSESSDADTEVSYSLPKLLADEVTYNECLQKGQSINWTLKGLTHEGEEEDGNENDGDNDGDSEVHGGIVGGASLKADDSCSESLDYSEARRIVTGCSAIVGMHPDQAAEHILEFAIRNNKPCAFVPCCVYSSQFPARKTEGGNLVRTYGQLVEYLLARMNLCGMCNLQPGQAGVAAPQIITGELPINFPGASSSSSAHFLSVPAALAEVDLGPEAEPMEHDVSTLREGTEKGDSKRDDLKEGSGCWSVCADPNYADGLSAATAASIPHFPASVGQHSPVDEGTDVGCKDDDKRGTLISSQVQPNWSKFGVVEMDFEGKNLMIFYLGDRVPLCDPFTVMPHVSKGRAQPEHWWGLTD